MIESDIKILTNVRFFTMEELEDKFKREEDEEKKVV